MGLTKLRAVQISNIDYKQSTRVITVTNVTLSGGAPTPVDGINLSVGDRVLVTGQSTGSQNGLYQVQTVGAGANGTWVRTSDGNETGEIEAGMIVMVTEGTVYADTQWKLTTNDPIVIGTTALTFEQNSAYAFGNISANGTAVLANAVGSAVTFEAGNNIAITGNNTTKTVTIGVTGISLNSISNGTSNVNVVSSGGNVTVGIAGTGNVAVFSQTQTAFAGNLIPSANVTYNLGSPTQYWKDLYLAGNSIYLGAANLTSSETTITVGTNLTATVLSATGNVQGGNIRTAGLISATGGVTAASVAGGVITGSSVSVTGTQTAASTVGGVITGSSVSVTGAQTAASTVGGVITGSSASVSGTVTAASTVGGVITGTSTSVSGGVTAASVAGGVITGSSTSVSGGVTAASVAGGVITGTSVSVSGNVTGANLTTAGTATIGGFTISGNTIVSAGSTLTIDPNTAGGVDGLVVIAGNLQVTGNSTIINSNVVSTNDLTINLANNAINSSAANGAGIEAGPIGAAFLTFLYNNTSNVWTSSGGLSAVGNITGGNLSVTSIAGTLTTAAQTNITSVGTLDSLSVTGNVQGGNLRTAGLISATGNISGNFFLGNGSLLTGISTSGSSNIANGTSNVTVVSSGGNVTVGIGGYSNVAIFGINTLSLGGPFATPKTINTNVSVAGSVNAVLVSPVTVDDLGNIFVPDSSTLTIFTPT